MKRAAAARAGDVGTGGSAMRARTRSRASAEICSGSGLEVHSSADSVGVMIRQSGAVRASADTATRLSISRVPFGPQRWLSMDRLLVRSDHVTRGEADGRGGVDVPVLVIEDGSHSFRLMEGFSDEERRSVRGELIAWLANHGRR